MLELEVRLLLELEVRLLLEHLEGIEPRLPTDIHIYIHIHAHIKHIFRFLPGLDLNQSEGARTVIHSPWVRG